MLLQPFCWRTRMSSVSGFQLTAMEKQYLGTRNKQSALDALHDGYTSEVLPSSGILVGDIKDEVPQTVVCSYFGAKSSKSGWKYTAATTQPQQASILSLYQRVYEVDEIPNKEITLNFARGLIMMSKGITVNWQQFADERREYREGLRKKKLENRELKREKDVGSPKRVGAKRCVAMQGGISSPSIQLDVKFDVDSVGRPGKVCKGLPKVRSKVGPSWEIQGLDSLRDGIEKSSNIVLESKTESLLQYEIEISSLEDELRRARMLLSDREIILMESSAEVAKCCKDLADFQTSVAKKRDLLKDLERTSTDSQLASQLRSEILSDEAASDKIQFHKCMEERTVARSEKVVASCQEEVASLEAELQNCQERKQQLLTTVSSLERLLQGMKEQLGKMQGGGGAAFFPRPVFDSPRSPMATMHAINACPVCTFWYSAFDFVSLGCGHTYHPFCLYEHSQSTPKDRRSA